MFLQGLSSRDHRHFDSQHPPAQVPPDVLSLLGIIWLAAAWEFLLILGPRKGKRWELCGLDGISTLKGRGFPYEAHITGLCLISAGQPGLVRAGRRDE